MVDPRAKGARGETQARDKLRELTGLKWERTPGSGALDPKHNLKGDLYIVNCDNAFCVEVKNYADPHINHLLIDSKTNTLVGWWEQTIRQAIQVGKKPLLLFKHNRSKLYVAFEEIPEESYNYIFVSNHNNEFYISQLESYIKFNKPRFIV